MHLIRKFIQKIGIDVHRYKKQPDKLEWLQEFEIKTVIDVGANVGQFAKEIREKLPNAFIYSFEPLKECFVELKKLEQLDNKIKAFNFALGEKDDKSIIHKSSYTLSSSLLNMSDIHKDEFPYTKDSTTEEIEVRKMDDIFEKIDLKKEILIKVDTQGYEDRVINGGLKIFSIAKVIIIETSFVSLYDGQPLFNNIYSSLTSINFTYRGAIHQKIGKNGEILFEDSLFVKI